MSTVGSGTSWKSSDGVPDQFPKGLRVLVVDDDPTCLRILEKMLRNCLYEVTKCNRAEIALQYLRDNKNGFDVVISDVHMPDMDGFKLLKQVGLEMDLPVIMMSADDSKSVVMKGVTHGACDYLIKPVRMEALKNIWQHVVRKRKSDSKDKDFEQRDRDFEQSGSVEDGERKHKQLLDDADYSSSANEGNWKSSRKRKEEDDEGEDNDDTSTMTKPRVAWSVELHQQFVGAVNQLGMDKAVPKKILELMNVPGLTRENVASHLQKYRLYLRRASVSQHQNGLNGSFMGPADANFAAMSSLHGFDFQALATSQIPPQSLASLQAAALCRPPPSKSPLTVVDSRNLFSFQSPKLLGNNNTEQMNLLHGIPTNMEPKQLASLNQSVQVNSQTSENNPMIMQMNSRAQMLNEINSTPVSTVPSSVGQPILLNGLARSGSSANGIYTAVSEGSPMVDFSMNNGSQLLGSSYSNVRHIVPSSLTSKGMMMMQGEVNLGGVKKSRGFVPNHEFFNEPQQYRATTEWGLQNVGSTFDPVARGNVEVLPSTYVQPGLSSVAHKSWQDNTGEAMFSRGDGGGHISNPNFGLPINPFVCKFLEVSKLSFSPEYGPKLKEAYVMVKHLPKIHTGNDRRRCCSCQWFSCCRDNWQKVWAVLKPGFLAFLKDPFETQPLDIIVFDVLPTSNGNAEGHALLAKEVKDRNPLRHYFRVSCGIRSIRIRLSNNAKVKDWVAAINDAALRPHEGWCQPHRFGSFAPPRGMTEDGSQAQWFVDGRAAFEAIALAIEEAKSEIFICGWWLCPELYLRRPFQDNASSRLDALLEMKAKQGVQVYILLYKEVALALKINSVYSKKKLLSIHENVKVLRYPDHFSTGVYLWSHHEKIVIVDHQICFLGGLDLCFGRYDSFEHKVGDYPPAIWPGKDYYNPRESEPNSWEDTMKDELDRGKYPRMPWHDVHCALWGPPCRDVARHFVQRWNYAKRNKAPNETTIPLLMPQQHMVIPHYLGNNKNPDENRTSVQTIHKETRKQDSFSSSNQDIPLLIPQEADGLDIPREETETSRLTNGHSFIDQPSRPNRSTFSFRKSKIAPVASDMPMKGFVDDLDATDSQQMSSMKSGVGSLGKDWWEKQDRAGLVDLADETGQVGPRISCQCQVLRSVSQWSAGTSQIEESIHNAYCSLIEKAEHFVYIENQFFISGLSGDDIIRNRVLEALYQRIIRAYNEKRCFRVIIVIPLLPGFQGGVDDGGAASVRAIMHWQYRTISRGNSSILQNLFNLIGPRVHDYISFYGLRSYGRLFDGGPVATSQVYVHSKIMIIDDCKTLIGSANINDRSLLGSRDSEINVLIEDKEVVDSFMGGKPWMAGKFALSLRLSLWSEHLGLQAGEVGELTDPVIESTYKDIWMATAMTNTMIYQDVFSCIPNDLIHSRISLRQGMAYWKEKLGHTTIDLGITPDKLDSYENGSIKETNTMERLTSVKGHLVSFPLEFMCKEDLRPVFNESEYYASAQVFH